MAIWLKVVTVALLLTAAPSDAQELVKVPVQIPAITPAVTAFVVARERGYYRQEGHTFRDETPTSGRVRLISACKATRSESKQYERK
jgi:hypothetical protein